MSDARATVRLQLNRDFTLADATAQVPYYAALGITHFYLSPITEAVAGSTHGYDVIDPTRISEALGGEAAFRGLVARLRAHGMGVILDIVPNHLAAHPDNPWWRDVLARGRASAHAGAFDIDWDAPGCEGKLWLPILPATLHEVIERGEIRLRTGDDGTPCVQVFGQSLPLNEGSHAWLAQQPQALFADGPLSLPFQTVEAVNASPSALGGLLAQQCYRLAHWRSGNDVVNYRRFFDITGLVALAMERPGVFARVHALPLRLVGLGLVDGLRVDHVDGLARPARYLQRLRRAMDRASRSRPEELPAVTLHVEKILAANETLPATWPVDGTTGYDFMDQVAALWHDRAGVELLDALWARRHGHTFDAGQRQARTELMRYRLHSDFSRCLRASNRYLAHTPLHGDLSTPAQARAIAAMAGAMTVYRTYLADGAAQDDDIRALDVARERALQTCATHERWAIAAIARQLAARPVDRVAGKHHRLACQRFEQLCAPLNAKAVEDTAFYRYGALLSRNEVGSSPARPPLSIGAFHQLMGHRARRWPRSMLATATHDHKRGEDTRARLIALSSRAHWLIALAQAWFPRWQIDAPEVPERVLWVLLQTLLSAWPLGLSPEDENGTRAFSQRIQAWLQKAEREAGLATSWTDPDQTYETACSALVARLLEGRSAPWCRSLADAARALDGAGVLIGLGSVLLRLTVPGTPDLYQGGEFWDQSLVDPDNRRPPDYDARASSLASTLPWAELMNDFRDGRLKQRLIHDLLQLRRACGEVFACGDYLPLAAVGERADDVLAFARSDGNVTVLVMLARPGRTCLASLETPLPPAAYWRDTCIVLPQRLRALRWRDALADGPGKGDSDERCTAALLLRHLFAALPFAVYAASPMEPVRDVTPFRA